MRFEAQNTASTVDCVATNIG